MATKSKSTQEIPEKIAESANAYIERVAESHERFAAGVETARERSVRIGNKLTEALLASQRDAIELTKSLVTDPTAYGKNIESVMDSMTLAQERALDVGKTLYREQAELGAELRQGMETYFQAGKMFSKPFEKMNEMWTQAAK